MSDDPILQALKRVMLPGTPEDVVSAGAIQHLKAAHGVVTFTVELPSSQAPNQERLEAELRAALKDVPGARDVAILFKAGPERKPPAPKPQAQTIRHVIAVGSGKGGVGKSTVSANLALALAETGARVGLLDADIYGPSIPLMMGVGEKKPDVVDQKLQPIVAHGVKLMSMGFLLPEQDSPVVWRGPMLGSALRQFFQDVAWGDLDYLVVDLPPGTGDVPLSLVQLMQVAGAAIVITPQPVAVSIGIKTLRMFQQSKVPILGVIENMSHFACSHCGTATHIFDQGGGRRFSEAEGIPFLGEIPLDPKIRMGGDAGKPVFVAEPTSPQAEAFRQVARSLVARVDETAQAAR